MAAIKPAGAARFLADPPATCAAFLLFGPDETRIALECEALARRLATRSAPPGEIVRLAGDDFTRDPDRLAVELRTLPLFGGRNIAWVRNAPQLSAELVAGLLGEPLAAWLVIEGGNLKRDNKLRQAFEAAPTAAAIAFYEPDAQSQAALIQRALGEAGLTADRAALAELGSLIGQEAGFIAGEIAKLAAYVAPATHVTVADVAAMTGDLRDAAMGEAIAATMAQQAPAALDALDRLLAGGDSAAQFLAALNGHLLRLHRVGAEMAAGKSLDSAMRALRPPVFFKQEAAFRRECERWPLERSTAALVLVSAATRTTRLLAAHDHAVASDTIMQLARAR